MEIQILISKKGTKVVTAHQLHQALRLTDYKYNQNLEHWLTDIYAFNTGVRQPVEMKDYSKRSFQYSKLQDFYISLELAILITLRSNSPVKSFYAKYLITMNNNQDNAKTTQRTNRIPKIAIAPEIIDPSHVLPNGVQLGLW